MNGYEATHKIRSQVPLTSQPTIIALTANAFEENKRQCLLSGMDYVLTKPLQKNQLLEVLSEITKHDLGQGCSVCTNTKRRCGHAYTNTIQPI
jgi:CheY-like chemotaxis protein